MGREDDNDGEGLMDDSNDEKDKNASEDIDDPDTDDTDVDTRKKYKCTEPGCTARFLRPSRLTWHLRKHNDERPYKCNREGCNRAYTNSSHLKRHQNTSHNTVITKLYRCKKCDVQVGSLYSLNRHCRKIHNPDRLTCEQCGAKFRKKHCYTEHLSMHAGIMIYNCKVCNQEYSTQRLLRRHERIHEKQKTYGCKSSGCKEIFDKWSLLVKHVETAHQFDHKCEICEKKFRLQIHLSSHEAVHKNEGNYVMCPYDNCPKYYCYQKNLNEHIDSFHLGRKFYCDNCPGSFTSKASIVRHIKAIHEFPKTPKKRKKQRKRKDAGKFKKSMATKLAGLELPYELEKRIVERKTRIQLDERNVENLEENVENSEGNAENLEEYVENSEGNVENLEEIVENSVGNVENFDKNSVENFEEISQKDAEKYLEGSEKIFQSLKNATIKFTDNEFEVTSMIPEEKDKDDFHDMSEQMDLEISLLAANELCEENLKCSENNSHDFPKSSDLIDQRISPFLFIEIPPTVGVDFLDKKS